MSRPRTITLLLHTVLAWAACAQSDQRFTAACIGFYNIENLFDTIDSPDTDDVEYTPGSKKQWGTARYRTKVEKMGRVIGKMGRDVHPDGLHIVGLAEVENRRVLEDLVKAEAIADRGYRIVHEEGPDRRGVDVGLLYNPRYFTLLGYRSVRLTDAADTSFRTRDQLLVSGIMDGDTMHVIVAHWPSRRGGEKRSQPKRMLAARLGRALIDSLQQADPGARVLYMGDLNDDPVDKSVRGGLMAEGNKEKAVGRVLFNPMLPLYEKGIGSLAWRDSWNLFDQIILTPALVDRKDDRYRYYGARVYNEPFLRQSEGAFMGYPFRTFVGDTWTDGWSDHFPVFVILVRPVK